MSVPYLGEIRAMAFNFAPKGWALCNGQLMAISQNQALFSLLGTTFGGDGRTTFGLPNLQGRTCVHAANGASMALGAVGGQEAHTLITSEIPSHTHAVNGSTTAAASPVPTDAVLASATNLYSKPASLSPVRPGSLMPAGGSQPHDNMQPYLVVNFCIALVGAYPSRS